MFYRTAIIILLYLGYYILLHLFCKNSNNLLINFCFYTNLYIFAEKSRLNQVLISPRRQNQRYAINNNQQIQPINTLKPKQNPLLRILKANTKGLYKSSKDSL